MDYKDSLRVLAWHAENSKLNGGEASTLIVMAMRADYKTGKIAIGYADLMAAIQLSKVTIAKAVASLIQKKAITLVGDAKGRSTATYRIRSVDELNMFFVVKSKNEEFESWHQTHDEQFGELERKHSSIGDGCPDCKADKKCEMHTYHLNKLEESTPWREYKLWMIDHPKPKMFVKKIGDREVL